MENQILEIDRTNFLPDTPNIDGRPVVLLSEQQLRRSVPQRDDSIRIGPLLVCIKSTRQPKIRDFQFAPGKNVMCEIWFNEIFSGKNSASSNCHYEIWYENWSLMKYFRSNLPIVDENVAALDIAMQEVLLVRVLYALQIIWLILFFWRSSFHLQFIFTVHFWYSYF